MKYLSIFSILLLFYIQSQSQIISGRIINAETNEPLEYVSIGVINTSIGIITDDKGFFKIDVKGLSDTLTVRISMISYKPQTFQIEQLVGKENIIKLIEAPTKLAVVIIKPSGKSRKVGITGTFGWKSMGWGGSNWGKGQEKGAKIALGNSFVQLKSFHIHLRRQSFKSFQFRLHIRNIIDNLPSEELLSKNIIITTTKESGWIDFDLSPYNLVLTGDIAVSIEWLKVEGVFKDRAMKINDNLQTEYILFNQIKKGTFFNKKGTEASWTRTENMSPCLYFDVLE
jgi:hypothetical protein